MAKPHTSRKRKGKQHVLEPITNLGIGKWVIAYDKDGHSFPLMRIGYFYARVMLNDPWDECGRKEEITLPVRGFVGYVEIPNPSFEGFMPMPNLIK